MMQNSLHYVYLHLKADDGIPFYVGKGLNNSKQEWYRAYSTGDRTLHWHNTVKKHGYTVVIWLEDLDEETAYEQEKLLIAKYGRQDLGTGTLVNMTDGGDGVRGMTKQQLSDRAKKSAMGKTAEQRSAVSRATLASQTPLQRAARTKKSWDNMSPEDKLKRANLSFQNSLTPEQRSERTRKSWIARKNKKNGTSA